MARWFLAGCGRRRREVGHPPVGAPSPKHQEYMCCEIAVVLWTKLVLPPTPERIPRARNSFRAEIKKLEPRTKGLERGLGGGLALSAAPFGVRRSGKRWGHDAEAA